MDPDLNRVGFINESYSDEESLTVTQALIAGKLNPDTLKERIAQYKIAFAPHLHSRVRLGSSFSKVTIKVSCHRFILRALCMAHCIGHASPLGSTSFGSYGTSNLHEHP